MILQGVKRRRRRCVKMGRPEEKNRKKFFEATRNVIRNSAVPDLRKLYVRMIDYYN
jgi:ribosomal protein S14